MLQVVGAAVSLASSRTSVLHPKPVFSTSYFASDFPARVNFGNVEWVDQLVIICAHIHIHLAGGTRAFHSLQRLRDLERIRRARLADCVCEHSDGNIDRMAASTSPAGSAA